MAPLLYTILLLCGGIFSVELFWLGHEGRLAGSLDKVPGKFGKRHEFDEGKVQQLDDEEQNRSRSDFVVDDFNPDSLDETQDASVVSGVGSIHADVGFLVRKGMQTGLAFVSWSTGRILGVHGGYASGICILCFGLLSSQLGLVRADEEIKTVLWKPTDAFVVQKGNITETFFVNVRETFELTSIYECGYADNFDDMLTKHQGFVCQDSGKDDTCEATRFGDFSWPSPDNYPYTLCSEDGGNGAGSCLNVNPTSCGCIGFRVPPKKFELVSLERKKCMASVKVAGGSGLELKVTPQCARLDTLYAVVQNNMVFFGKSATVASYVADGCPLYKTAGKTEWEVNKDRVRVDFHWLGHYGFHVEWHGVPMGDLTGLPVIGSDKRTFQYGSVDPTLVEYEMPDGSKLKKVKAETVSCRVFSFSLHSAHELQQERPVAVAKFDIRCSDAGMCAVTAEIKVPCYEPGRTSESAILRSGNSLTVRIGRDLVTKEVKLSEKAERDYGKSVNEMPYADHSGFLDWHLGGFSFESIFGGMTKYLFVIAGLVLLSFLGPQYMVLGVCVAGVILLGGASAAEYESGKIGNLVREQLWMVSFNSVAYGFAGHGTFSRLICAGVVMMAVQYLWSWPAAVRALCCPLILPIFFFAQGHSFIAALAVFFHITATSNFVYTEPLVRFCANVETEAREYLDTFSPALTLEIREHGINPWNFLKEDVAYSFEGTGERLREHFLDFTGADLTGVGPRLRTLRKRMFSVVEWSWVGTWFSQLSQEEMDFVLTTGPLRAGRYEWDLDWLCELVSKITAGRVMVVTPIDWDVEGV